MMQHTSALVEQPKPQHFPPVGQQESDAVDHARNQVSRVFYAGQPFVVVVAGDPYRDKSHTLRCNTALVASAELVLWREAYRLGRLG
jgi:hypothetical protein